MTKDPNPATLPIAKSLFEREAQILYRLGNDYDQIPRLFAHFEEKGEFYLVQEFVDGDDLTKEITPGLPKNENVVLKLLQDILEVLAVVHQHNVIHRDIKPQNLMRRRRDGKIILIDFGAVKEIGVLGLNTQGQTSVTVAIGSPGYMPNEQANGRPKLCSDVYAVGIIGIQALTGLEPNQLQEDSSTGQIIWRNYAQVNSRLADVLDRMVHPYFSQRYQFAGEALQSLISTVVTTPMPVAHTVMPLQVSSQSSIYPVKQNSFYKKTLLVGGAIVLIGLGGYGIWQLYTRETGILSNPSLPTSSTKADVSNSTSTPTSNPKTDVSNSTSTPTSNPKTDVSNSTSTPTSNPIRTQSTTIAEST